MNYEQLLPSNIAAVGMPKELEPLFSPTMDVSSPLATLQVRPNSEISGFQGNTGDHSCPFSHISTRNPTLRRWRPKRDFDKDFHTGVVDIVLVGDDPEAYPCLLLTSELYQNMINMLKEMRTLKSAKPAFKEEARNILNSTQTTRAKINRWEAELHQIEDEDEDDHLAFDRSRLFITPEYLLGQKIEAEEQRQYNLRTRYRKQAEYFRDSKVECYNLCQELSKSLDPAFACIALLPAQAAQENYDLLLKLPKPGEKLDLFDILENNERCIFQLRVGVNI